MSLFASLSPFHYNMLGCNDSEWYGWSRISLLTTNWGLVDGSYNMAIIITVTIAADGGGDV